VCRRQSNSSVFLLPDFPFGVPPPGAPRHERREVKRMLKLSAWVHSFVPTLRREEGQTMAEYGVILAVITIAVLAALGFLSGQISNAVNRVASAIT
jgi:Flp pilus assembly pilin Flp